MNSRDRARLLGALLLAVGVVTAAYLSRTQVQGVRAPTPPTSESPEEARSPLSGMSPTGGRSPATDRKASFDPDALQDVAGCWSVLEDERNFLACIRSVLDRRGLPSARDLGGTICSGPDTYPAYVRMLGEVLVRTSPSRALRFLSDVQFHCDRYRETPVHIDVLVWAASRDPKWAEAVARDTAAVDVLDPATSEGAVQALQYFVERGDERLRGIVEEGGRGLLGGSGAQILRSATIAFVVQAGPVGRWAYAESLLDSPQLPAGELVGCQIAHQLSRADAWPDGNCEAALTLLARVLEDPRIRAEAAAQLTRGENSTIPEPCRPLWIQITALRDQVLAGVR